MVSAEVLLRWHDEVLGNVSPARFIPLAEEVGLMPSIGRWVLSTALRHFAQWQRVQLAPATIAVNLSAHQLYDPDLTATVLAALSESGVAPHCLPLEITESAMMRDPNLAKQQVEELAKLGITFAIDDFGTGYSSLAYLHTFPLTKLKIDRTFVAPLATDDTDDAIVDATIQMAHRLGLQVVAEGVECEAQRDHLRRLGCNLYQGYWFARPMGAIEFATFCQQHR